MRCTQGQWYVLKCWERPGTSARSPNTRCFVEDLPAYPGQKEDWVNRSGGYDLLMRLTRKRVLPMIMEIMHCKIFDMNMPKEESKTPKRTSWALLPVKVEASVRFVSGDSMGLWKNVAKAESDPDIPPEEGPEEPKERLSNPSNGIMNNSQAPVLDTLLQSTRLPLTPGIAKGLGWRRQRSISSMWRVVSIENRKWMAVRTVAKGWVTSLRSFIRSEWHIVEGVGDSNHPESHRRKRVRIES